MNRGCISVSKNTSQTVFVDSLTVHKPIAVDLAAAGTNTLALISVCDENEEHDGRPRNMTRRQGHTIVDQNTYRLCRYYS